MLHKLFVNQAIYRLEITVVKKSSIPLIFYQKKVEKPFGKSKNRLLLQSLNKVGFQR